MISNPGEGTVSIFPDIVRRGIRAHAHGSVDRTCQEIHEACKGGWGGDKRSRIGIRNKIGKGTGLGVDDKRVIEVIGRTTGEERHLLSQRFKEIHGEHLCDVFASCLSGDFGVALELLALSPVAADCRLIQIACDGVGAKELYLFPIVCGRSNEDRIILQKTFLELNQTDLGKLMLKKLSFDLEKLVYICMHYAEEKYDPKIHTEEQAHRLADCLFEQAEAENWFGTNGNINEAVFTRICVAPPPFLTLTDKIHCKKYGHPIFYSVCKAQQLNPSCKKAALFSIGMKIRPFETVAKLIKSACAGLGTDELLLTSCIVRYQGILKEVALAHLDLFERSLQDRIRGETSGSYKRLLLALVDAALPEPGS